jgi:SAM-dependent methyltransferase
MRIILTSTWNPRGEDGRLVAQLQNMREIYAGIVIVLPPAPEEHILALLKEHNLPYVTCPEWSWGRYLALKTSLELEGDFIHYVDMDRLLRWVETRPEEWRRVVTSLGSQDCVVFSRSSDAYMTHPQAMIQTERISNLVTSFFLEKPMDVSAGSKAFSRQAASYLLEQTQPQRAIGTDAEWLILLKRAGFTIETVEVNGLDYESADRFQTEAADAEKQRRAAGVVDENPKQWARRVEIAHEIVQSALEAQKKIIPGKKMAETVMETTAQDHFFQFNLEEVFEVNDYLYFYSESLTDERTDAEVNSIINLLELKNPVTILDLACGYGRYTNRLAAMGHRMTGVDINPGFIDIARRDAVQRGVEVKYIQEDMRRMNFNQDFDYTLLLFTAFGYFSDEENLLVLKNIAKALKPGGQVIFDTHNRDNFLKNILPCFVTEKEGNLMIDRGTFDSLTGYWENRRIVIRNGVRRDKPFKIRLYNPNEIREWLERAGLTLEGIYGSWDGQPISPEKPRMIIIGRKPEY